MAMLPHDHAAALISHYFKSLASHAGLRWTPANDADMQTLAGLLDQAEPQDDADTIPPFSRGNNITSAPPALETRVTRELDYGDPAFARWRAERAEDEKIEAARRMTRR